MPQRSLHFAAGSDECSWFVTAGLRKPVMVGYATVALVLMAVFFKVVQERWPGRGGVKGLVFQTSLAVVLLTHNTSDQISPGVVFVDLRLTWRCETK